MNKDLRYFCHKQKMGPHEAYRYLMDDISDPRLKDWPFVGSPLPVLLILGGYLGFVLHWGPRFMKNREAYSLSRFMIGYNIAVAVSSGIILYGLLTSGFTTSLSLGCEPVRLSYTPEAIRMTKWVWWLLIVKIVELIDTIVFILRKKFNQASFLHIYHHVVTVTLAWMLCKYVPGGMWVFNSLPNCFVHVIMYTYYLLTSFGPEVRKKLAPWKPYLTMLQLIQFAVMFIHTAQMFHPSCEPNRRPLAYLWMFNVVVIAYMFLDFYKKSYCKKAQ